MLLKINKIVLDRNQLQLRLREPMVEEKEKVQLKVKVREDTWKN